jgi:hypothetical protein
MLGLVKLETLFINNWIDLAISMRLVCGSLDLQSIVTRYRLSTLNVICIFLPDFTHVLEESILLPNHF